MKRVLKGVAALIGMVVLAVVVCIGIGHTLPVSHTVTRSLHIVQPVDSVYALVRDFASYPTWRAGVTRVEVLAEEPLRFRETSQSGVISYDVIEDVPRERLVTRIADTDLGFGGSWTYTLTPDATGTTLAITEDGVVTNAFFRFMSRFVFGHAATIEQYLTDVRSRFGDAAR